MSRLEKVFNNSPGTGPGPILLDGDDLLCYPHYSGQCLLVLGSVDLWPRWWQDFPQFQCKIPSTPSGRPSTWPDIETLPCPCTLSCLCVLSNRESFCDCQDSIVRWNTYLLYQYYISLSLNGLLLISHAHHFSLPFFTHFSSFYILSHLLFISIPLSVYYCTQVQNWVFLSLNSF